MKIVKIEDSPRKSKRFRVYLDDDKYYDFGLDGASTYIDHHDTKKRYNYIRRHHSNPKEKNLIDNLIPSPALFSLILLWGPYKEIEKNIEELNELWNE